MKPFLKWAGGKHRLVPRIQEHLPAGDRLIEPFLGSGALFLNVEYPAYKLSDVNADLIQLYQVLQEQGLGFIDYCAGLFIPENNIADRYYALRERFNSLDEPAEKSAIFLYLNRHGFNGLCRYNRSGGFNVPFGRYKKPYFPNDEMVHFWQHAQRAEFVCADFADVMAAADPGDVLYCDPPYVPLSATANFTSYAAAEFGQAQQEQLADLARGLSGRGVPVVISNHATEFTRQAYIGSQIHEFMVQRNISRDGDNRNPALELLAVFEGNGEVARR